MQREIDHSIVEKARTIKPNMKSIIIDTPEGITVTELYKRMDETGENENAVRAAFLNLALTEGVYLDKDHKVRISSQE